MKCNNCGKELNEYDEVCPVCGNKTLLSVDEKISENNINEIKASKGRINNRSDSFKIKAWISYAVALLCTGVGFYKMYYYNNPEYSFMDSVNAYVGGDAYNYIINSNYAAAWFTLAVAMVVLGSALLICSEIGRNADRRQNQTEI